MVDQAFGLRLRFKGASLEDGGLDLYDGATSFYGFAKALQIAVNAYHNETISSRATAIKRAELSFGSPRRGSVLFDIVAHLQGRSVEAPRSRDTFYDFMRVAFSRATGQFDVEPDSHYVSTKLENDEPFLDELAEALEGPLQSAHRSIDNDKIVVSLERPRSGLVLFNKKTSQWVHTRDENPETERFTGYITRFNSRTGNGRAFVREVGRIIPVRRAEDFIYSKRGNLTWSLHGDNVTVEKELELIGRKIESARGETKRILLTDCNAI